jgi:hypothetical protein
LSVVSGTQDIDAPYERDGNWISDGLKRMEGLGPRNCWDHTRSGDRGPDRRAVVQHRFGDEEFEKRELEEVDASKKLAEENLLLLRPKLLLQRRMQAGTNIDRQGDRLGATINLNGLLGLINNQRTVFAMLEVTLKFEADGGIQLAVNII